MRIQSESPSAKESLQAQLVRFSEEEADPNRLYDEPRNRMFFSEDVFYILSNPQKPLDGAESKAAVGLSHVLSAQQGLNYGQAGKLADARRIFSSLLVSSCLPVLATAFAFQYARKRLDICEPLTAHLSVLSSVQESPFFAALAKSNQARIYFQKRRYKESLALAEQALSIFEEIGTNRGVAIALRDMGNAYYELGKVSKAEHCFKRVLTIRETLAEPRELAAAYMDWVDISFRRMKFGTAEKFAQKALDLAESAGHIPLLVLARAALGHVNFSRGRVKQVIEHYEFCVKLNNSIGDQFGLAHDAFAMGRLCANFNDPQHAEINLKTALELFSSLGCELEMAEVHSYLAHQFHRDGQFRNAVEHLRQECQIYLRLEEHELLAEAFMNLGEAHVNLGDDAEACECFRKSLSIYSKLKKKKRVAEIEAKLLEISNAGKTSTL